MAKGSQLVQLKSALSDAGLSRQSHSKTGNKRKRSRAVTPLEKDKAKAQKKLLEIRERLNPFDVKVTRLKHDVGGRKLKGVSGRPGSSRQAGIEQREKTLLVEYEQKNHAGGILDRRFGENDPSMAPEERMLERFTRERQRASKGAAFNLEDEDELTHYGQSLSALDDFDGIRLGLEDNNEDNGQIDADTVRTAHFGGFEDEEEVSGDEAPIKKKSKAEIMAEVIAKSKEHKYQRQMEKEQDEDTRFQLDQEFNSIRGLLFEDPGPSSTTGSNAVPLGRARLVHTQDVPIIDRDDQGYNQFVRELAFEKRAKPKDRTKTEEELALDEKEALEKAEKARIKRMMGVEDDSEDGDGRLRRKRKRDRGGDDLEDDFIDEDELSGLGVGLTGEEKHKDQDQDGNEIGSESDSEDATTDTSEDEQQELTDNDELGGHDIDAGGSLPVASSQKDTTRRKEPAEDQDLPFTFPCPSSHDEFLSIIENINDDSLPLVVQRIRALHHPSLSKDNPAKLQAFIGVLIDHILHIASPPTPNFSLVEALVFHVYALTQVYPVASAQAFVAKLSLMHKNLLRGLSNGATSPHSKTWPGSAELALLRVLGVVWSTSDMNHAVISPARVLIGAYLGLGRIRSITDLATGLFLCTVILQYEDFSKRFIPEAINFLLNAFLHLAPHPFKNSHSIPGSFPLPDFRSNTLAELQISDKFTKGLIPARPDLVSILCGRDLHPAQTRLDLLEKTLQLLNKFAEQYKGLDGFVELYTPVLEILRSVSLSKFPAGLQQLRSNLHDTVSRLLRFSGQLRRPLLLQAHKPIPIPSYVPKFSITSSNFLRKQDPDQERAAASKLRNQVKQERKGAIRELRKDSKFLAGVQQKRQMEEADLYKTRMKKVFSSIEGERAEQKASEREKSREKKRAGRK